MLLVVLLFSLTGPAQAQQQQCRTAPVGTVSQFCASEAFVTNSIAPVAANVATLQAQTAGYEAAWTSFTPTLTSAGGTLTTATASGRYKQIGKTILFSITGVITTNGTGSNWLRFTPPVAPMSTGNFTFNSYNVTDNVLLLGRFLAGSSNIDVFKIDGTYPGADGKTYIVSGTYESN